MNMKSLSFLNVKKSPEFILAVMVIGMILMMIMPMPAIILDFLLALSIASALIILMVSIYITNPLEFGVFPTVLLLTTLLRLSLNVATTRNILLHGAEGDISKLISAFGNLVIGGQFVVGLVVFIILMIINFVVITMGSGRIAEVAARFALDAMPGKQMAIDAELNAGHINAEEARKRRKAVENQADFYGSMDGASKFVRGDAIAGLIITVVNMVMGILIGILQYNMPIEKATKTFTLYSIGDGLLSAIPALMISTAAGIVVSRAASDGNLGDEMMGQFKTHPKAFYVAAFLCGLLSFFPGFPFFPFMSLASFMAWIGYAVEKNMEKQKVDEETQKQSAQEKEEGSQTNSLEMLMQIDILAVEVGHALISLIDPSQDGEVVDRVQSIRKQFAQELGIIVPQVQLRDNMEMPPGLYQILLKGNKVASGQLMVDYYLGMDPGCVIEPIEGDPTEDPVYHLPAIWVHKRLKEQAIFKGYTVVNCATVMATHLTKIVREHASELMTRQDALYFIDKLKETNPKVVEEEMGADKLSVGDVLKVFQSLLQEEVSIRDLLTIFECLADHVKSVRNPEVLCEFCRKSLGRHIIQRYLDENEELPVVSFDRTIEDILLSGLVVVDNGSSYLNVDATRAHQILNALSEGLQVFETVGTQPVILVPARLRLPFKKLISRYIPQIVVLSYDEIPSSINTKVLKLIELLK